MKNILPLALLVLAAVFGFGFADRKVNVDSVGINRTVFGARQEWRWIDKVEEGKELLKNSTPLSYTSIGSAIVEKQVALAVLDTLSGEVFEKRIWIKQNDASSSKTKRFEGIDVEIDKSYSPHRPARISNIWWNSFNSMYRVEPTHYAVVANKYLISSDVVPDFLEKEGKKYTEIVYVPYSENLHNPQLIAEGERYLEETIDRAFRELEYDQVKSQAGEKLVIDSASKDLIKRIVVTEHIDPDLLAVADDGGQKLADRVYVIFGTNKDRAYYYTSSSADARGPAQFIQGTYDGLVRKYPEAGLMRDFQLGASTHINAFKGMVLLFDEIRGYLGSLLKTINPDEVELALAASYNGNPYWVRESILLYGKSWLDHQEVRPILKRETFGYLKKLKALIHLDFLK